MDQIKGVIFDLDGTLGDSTSISVKSFQNTFLEFDNIELTRAQIIDLWGPSEEGVFKRHSPQNWKNYLEYFLHEYEKLHSALGIGIFAGISEIFEFLKESGIRVALVTAKGAQSAEISLRYFGIKEIFDYIETGSANGLNKADRIQQVVRAWGYRPAQVLYVGDVPSDITASRASRVVAVSACWSGSADLARLISHQPDFLFESTSDFLNWLRHQLT